jgi:hypothetical protein
LCIFLQLISVTRVSPAKRPGGNVLKHEPRDVSGDAATNAHYAHQNGVERKCSAHGKASAKISNSENPQLPTSPLRMFVL